MLPLNTGCATRRTCCTSITRAGPGFCPGFCYACVLPTVCPVRWMDCLVLDCPQPHAPLLPTALMLPFVMLALMDWLPWRGSSAPGSSAKSPDALQPVPEQENPDEETDEQEKSPGEPTAHLSTNDLNTAMPDSTDSAPAQTSSSSAATPSSNDGATSEPPHSVQPSDTASTDSSHESASASSSPTLGELDRVRDLLFGEHERETNERLDRLETKVENQLRSLRNDLQEQIDVLDTFAREEKDELADRLSEQKKAHRSDVANLEREIQELSRSLADTREDLQEALDRAKRSFREDLHTQKKTLDKEISDQHDELSELVEAAVSQLRGQATDRRSLADLFDQMATRLRE